MNFLINGTNELLEGLVLHFRDDTIPCNSNNCQTLRLVSSFRYPGLTFGKNLRWNRRVNDLVMRLRSLSYSFCKSRYILPAQTLRIVYLSLYRAIFQYGLLACGGLADYAVLLLIAQQKQFIHLCLCKTTFEGFW